MVKNQIIEVVKNHKAGISIGQVGKPFYDPMSDRVKFFSQKHYVALSQLEEDIAMVLQEQKKYDASRMTMRAVVNSEMSSRFSANPFTYGNLFHFVDSFVEAQVPLLSFDGSSVLYFANNSPSRNCLPEVIANEDWLVKTILSSQKTPSQISQPIQSQIPSQISSQNESSFLFQNRYSIEKIELPLSANDVTNLISVYNQAFQEYICEFNADSIQSLVDGNIVYVARDKEQNNAIVSVVVAELSAIIIAGKKLQFSELSDMATAKSHLGLGLNRLCAEKAIAELSDYDMIYTEARASHIAINKVFYNIGFSYAGRVIKHCLISSVQEVAETGKYENLNVWYLPTQKNIHQNTIGQNVSEGKQ